MLFVKRKAQIDEVLKDLYDLKNSGAHQNTYAIDANINFFKAIKTFRGYVAWFFKERLALDGRRLLELSDFQLADGKWERILQSELLEIEKWKFPDNLRPLRLAVLDAIKTLSDKKDILTVINLGSGAMECERQVIEQLRKQKSTQRILFVGIDSSLASVEAALDNLKDLNLKIIKIPVDSMANTIEASSILGSNQYGILIIAGDALALPRYLGGQKADLLFYTKFRHHLSEEAKPVFDNMTMSSAGYIIEEDNLNNLFMFIVPLIIRSRWNHPILLNGAFFSVLRDPTKNDIQRSLSGGWKVHFSPSIYIKHLNVSNN